MASVVLEISSKGYPFGTAQPGCICSLVPDYLLEDIIESDQIPERGRACARLTLQQCQIFRERRLGRTTPEDADQGDAMPDGGYGIVPDYVQQDIKDSEESTQEDKDRAQKALDMKEQAQASTLTGQSLLGRSKAIQEMVRIVYDAKGKSRLPGSQIREEGDASVKDVNVNQVYDFFGATHKAYAELFNRDSIDDNGITLQGTVHYDDEEPPAGFNNAFWNGERMVFGDGDNIMFATFTGAVDVIAHELTHGVVEHTANLPYWSQSGALNESFADVFGSIVKQYQLQQTSQEADWLIGASIFAKDFRGRALRDMKAPGTAYDDPRLRRKDRQVGHMKDYQNLPMTRDGDNGGVHINSGIPNRAFYLTATKLGGNSWDVAGPIWYNTLCDPRLRTFAQTRVNWPSCFSFFAALTVEHAKAFDSTAVQVVKDAWDAVGVNIGKL